jgi:Fe-S-cluster containining protein
LKPLIELQQRLQAEADLALDAAFAEAEKRADTPYACRAGCSACCHQVVLCTAPEALLIASRLREILDPAALATSLARLDAQSLAGAGVGFLDYSRARIPCAFLDGSGACSIYEFRPMACRALKSFSVAACERLPEALSDLGAHAIPGSGPGLRVAKTAGAQHYRLLAAEAEIDPLDFTLMLPRAVAIAVRADVADGLPDFGPARLEHPGPA